ncbi:9045_t:CDS:1, partial [Cetraspora pellucida]
MSKNETFSDELVNDFLGLYKSKDKSYDTIIYIDKKPYGEKIYAHSLILSTRSVYFSKALSENWVKKQDGYFILTQPNTNGLVFEIILKYLYCGILNFENLDIDMIFSFLVTVDKLLIQELFDYIQIYLITSDLLESQSCKILNFVINNPSFTTIKKNLLETI